MTDRYVVIGHPVAHSKSPFIHKQFAAQTGQDLVYEAIDAEPGGFTAAVERFRDAGGYGLNVTLPFKEEAFRLATTTTERAQRALAVNTLCFEEDGVRGDNTDGVGLIRDLKSNLKVTISGQRCLLIGAGGAARGVLGPLLDEAPAELVIANRTAERAYSLLESFQSEGPLRVSGFETLEGLAFDLVINATSAGVRGETPPVPPSAIRAGGCAYDMMYDAGPTAFVEWGQAAGAGTAVDGLGMLVEQAAESFYVWRGTRPQTRPVLDSLRRVLERGETG
jgi:shikimate dehydrogenase